MNEQRIINAVHDCISRFKASKYPLKNVASDIIASRKLNSHERKVLLDLVFAWARSSFLASDFLKNNLALFETMSEQQKDHSAISLIAHQIAGIKLGPDHLMALHKPYEAYIASLGDERFVRALGPLIAEELKLSFGHEANLVAKGLSLPPKKWLAFDRHTVSKEQLLHELQRLKLKAESHSKAPNALSIDGDLKLASLPKAMHDQVWFMDAGSQIIAELIKAKPSDRVLDMCAGEGGKARYITMNPCEYVAMDIDQNRLQYAKKRLANKKIQFIAQDAKNAQDKEGFDWILLDAPCSGSGGLRRHPDLKYRLTKAMLKDYQQSQRALLAKAFTLMRPGAKLIYVSCSLFNSENMQQVDRLLLENDTAIVNRCFTLFPHLDDCDGFFCAVITNSKSH